MLAYQVTLLAAEPFSRSPRPPHLDRVMVLSIVP